MKGWNATNITLIPKVKNLRCISNFRPINLYNVSYKIITKVLANRLKRVLDAIISPAFTSSEARNLVRKALQLSSLISARLLTGWNRPIWNNSCLSLVLPLIGSPLSCSGQFSILINGRPTGTVTPFRGIRQGDPLSS